MKANEKDSQTLSDAIDQVNEGMEAIVELYNNLEDDRPLIRFNADVMAALEKAKEKYGDDFVDEKINSMVKEMLGWLSLDDINETSEKGLGNDS
ncbi:atypical membrane-integrating protein (Mistic protein) [Camelliibacillus cellulosilyticus]|uniref:Atypical membrane-integrating protein (Mistic protein) n=1 Tax=Camelliibacillus cellulosilyticus TaxID=2174486 RepID=A0ABV9GLD7_9BACL